MFSLIIPEYQPIALPAPLWLLQTLLVLGFYLHVLPMNVSLGGGLTAGLYLLRGHFSNDANAKRIGLSLGKSLPLFISFAVTQGIVPLLFLQLIYGPLYYTSSIIMAVPWIALLILLMAGYYACYVFKLRHQSLGLFNPVILIGVTLIFAVVGFLFTNNMTLMLTPEKWPALVQSVSPSGLHFNLDEPQLWPRYLHFLFAALAVTGLAVGCFGLYHQKQDAAYSKWLIQAGAGQYLLISLLQIGIGMWFMFSLPHPIMHNFMGGQSLATGLFMGSMGLSVVSILAMLIAWKNGSSRFFKAGLHSGLLVIFLMVVMRHMLRLFYVQPFSHPELLPVKVQWDLLIVFVILAVLLIGYLVWLTRLVLKAYQPSQLESN